MNTVSLVLLFALGAAPPPESAEGAKLLEFISPAPAKKKPRGVVVDALATPNSNDVAEAAVLTALLCKELRSKALDVICAPELEANHILTSDRRHVWNASSDDPMQARLDAVVMVVDGTLRKTSPTDATVRLQIAVWPPPHADTTKRFFAYNPVVTLEETGPSNDTRKWKRLAKRAADACRTTPLPTMGGSISSKAPANPWEVGAPR